MTDNPAQALQTILDELKVLSPEIKNAFIYDKTGEPVASYQEINQDQTKAIKKSLDSITDYTKAVDDIESLTIQTLDSQLSISTVNGLYLTAIFKREANPKVIHSLTRVIIPTVMGLVNGEKIDTPENKTSLKCRIAEPEMLQETIRAYVKPLSEPAPPPEPPSPLEPVLPLLPTKQFMVEKINGFMVAGDTVRIDSEAVALWSELYEGKEISRVRIEALDGKKITCKCKPTKDAKANIKGIIHIPEKILQALETCEGNLVMVKPIINQKEA